MDMVSIWLVVFWMYKLFKGKYDFLVEENFRRCNWRGGVDDFVYVMQERVVVLLLGVRKKQEMIGMERNVQID